MKPALQNAKTPFRLRTSLQSHIEGLPTSSWKPHPFVARCAPSNHEGPTRCRPLVVYLYMMSGYRCLVLSDLGNGTHRAFFEALATCDARVFVHNFSYAARNLEDLLRARVNANATTNALVSLDNWMSHDDPFLGFVSFPENLSVRKIPLLGIFAN